MKRVGGAFLFIGLLTLCAALIKPRLGLIDKKLTQTEGQIQGSQAPIAPPPVTLANARQEIPEALKKIYAALNDGQPQNAAPFFNVAILNDAKGLDYLCQPFNYRAHYIESVVERPNKVFLARVRTLFKAGGERAYLMFFTAVSEHNFWLNRAEDDPLVNEKIIATTSARNLLFAARAGKWDDASKITVPRQRIEQYFGNFGDWPTAFAAIKGIETRTAVSTFDPVLMIKVPLVVETSYYEYVDVFTDPTGTRVVQIDWGGYNKRETIFKDSNLESNSLARFDLKTPEP